MELVKEIYRITKLMPKTEMYVLVSQMLRAAISIPSNIAEGFSRNSNLEKRQFYYQALGSLTEVQNQLLIARDLDYLSSNEFKRMADQSVIVSKLTNGLIKSVRILSRNT